MKTKDLTGHALDYAVAKICKLSPYLHQKNVAYDSLHHHGRIYFRPSTDWSQGGPIIEREQIALNLLFNQAPERLWMASATGGSHSPSVVQYGPTPLIAAMRCYVASKLGDEVDIPKELMEN